MAKNEKTESKEQKVEKSTKKVNKSSYSKNPNFKEMDGSEEIDQITRKIDIFLNV